MCYPGPTQILYYYSFPLFLTFAFVYKIHKLSTAEHSKKCSLWSWCQGPFQLAAEPWELLLSLSFMLQINLHDVSIGFPWLLLSQTHTSLRRSAQLCFFIQLPINSACNNSQLHWAFCETYTLDSHACYFIYARRQTNNFLILTVKIFPSSPTTEFSTDSLFMPSSRSQTIFDDRLKVKAEVHHFFTFTPVMVIFYTGVKGAILVLGLNRESRQALFSFHLEKGTSGHGSSPRTTERAMDLGRHVLVGHHPLPNKTLGKLKSELDL